MATSAPHNLLRRTVCSVPSRRGGIDSSLLPLFVLIFMFITCDRQVFSLRGIICLWWSLIRPNSVRKQFTSGYKRCWKRSRDFKPLVTKFHWWRYLRDNLWQIWISIAWCCEYHNKIFSIFYVLAACNYSHWSFESFKSCNPQHWSVALFKNYKSQHWSFEPDTNIDRLGYSRLTSRNGYKAMFTSLSLNLTYNRVKSLIYGHDREWQCFVNCLKILKII